MEIQLNSYEKMLLELLRAALSDRGVTSSLFKSADELTWKLCFNLAKKQGVMALAWDGIQTLPEEFFPPKSIKLSWAMQVESYEQKYTHYVKTLVHLKEFYAQHGIGLVQLKGVGLSSYYPNPLHREGGDIDIYTYSLDRSVMSDEEANQLADQLMENQGIDVDTESPKHSVFYYHGVPIENHHFFLNEYNIPYAKAMDEYLHRVCEPREVGLLNNQCTVPIPSPAFNQVFVPFHAMQHWSAGLCLHHLCDCAVIFQKHGFPSLDGDINMHFRKVLSVFAAFSNRYLGTDVEVEYSEELLELLMREVFRWKYDEEKVVENSLSVFFFKLRRLLHILLVRKKVIGESVGATIWRSICFHIKRPRTIFTLKK